MDENELTELLKLADGDRALPGDLEEKLLTEIVNTYRQAPATSRRSAEAAADEADPVIVELHDHDATRRGRKRPLRPWLLAAAAVIAVIVFVIRDSPQDVDVIAPPEPSVEVPPVALSDRPDAVLCEVLDRALNSAHLVGALALMVDIDDASLAQLVLATDELADRRRDGDVSNLDAIEHLGATAANLRIELERGTEASALAAYGPAREAASQSTSARAELCADG